MDLVLSAQLVYFERWKESILLVRGDIPPLLRSSCNEQTLHTGMLELVQRTNRVLRSSSDVIGVRSLALALAIYDTQAYEKERD
eukprot:scaffold28378_cov223-Skeletonema_marinoi.AAC.5